MLNEILLTYTASDNQNGLFTTAHRKYDCTIEYKFKHYDFSYQCNMNYYPNVEDCVDSLLLDAFTYDNAIDIMDFANELGYDIYDEFEKDKVKRIYKECKKTSKAIHDMFTEKELEQLQDELNNY